MTLVEKMARAMWGDDAPNAEFIPEAHAALQVVLDALREPSDETLQVFYDSNAQDWLEERDFRRLMNAIADHLAKE